MHIGIRNKTKTFVNFDLMRTELLGQKYLHYNRVNHMGGYREFVKHIRRVKYALDNCQY